MSNGQSKSPSLYHIGTGGNRPAVPPYLPGICARARRCGQRAGRNRTALAGHHHVPSLVTGDEPGLGLLAAEIRGRRWAGSSGGILGGCGAPACTGSGSLWRRGCPLTRLHHSFSDGSLALPVGVRQSGRDTGSGSFQSHSSGLALFPAATGAAAVTVKGCGRASGGRGVRPGRSRFPHRAIRSGCGWRRSGCCRIPR